MQLATYPANTRLDVRSSLETSWLYLFHKYSYKSAYIYIYGNFHPMLNISFIITFIWRNIINNSDKTRSTAQLYILLPCHLVPFAVWSVFLYTVTYICNYKQTSTYICSIYDCNISYMHLYTVIMIITQNYMAFRKSWLRNYKLELSKLMKNKNIKNIIKQAWSTPIIMIQSLN